LLLWQKGNILTALITEYILDDLKYKLINTKNTLKNKRVILSGSTYFSEWIFKDIKM
jgi:hypothetical protein